ncbi:MAG: hypothetical protein ACX94C_02350 [Phycisphaerales bacterium]
MFILIICCYAIALILIAIGIVGRVLGRGVYCCKCRFDLSGIDRASADARCPECGVSITSEKTTRTTLRAKRWLALVPGVLVLLVAIAMSGIAATNNTAKIMGALPDRVVLIMHAMGFNAAWTEIANNRLVRVNKSLSDETWSGLIDDALAHQRNEEIAWDQRHGEVLVHALTDGRLSPDQVPGYVRLGVETYTEFPVSIRHGAQVAGLEVKHSSSKRISALSQMGAVTYQNERVMIWTTVKRVSITEPSFEYEAGSTSGGMFSVPGGLGRSTGGQGIQVPIDELDWSLVEPDTELTFVVEYELAIKSQPSGNEIVRWSQTDVGTVTVLPKDAELVKLNTDPEMIESFRNKVHARVTSLYIPMPEERSAYGSVQVVLESDFVNSDLPIALSGDLYVLHGGQETRVSEVSANASQGVGIRMFTWTVPNDEPVDEDLLQSWRDAGVVTLEYRPNPGIAEATHDIREILGVTLRFTDVPVTTDKPPRKGYGNQAADDEIVGRPIDD